MERTTGKVKSVVLGRSFLVAIFFSFIFCTSILSDESRKDVLIVEHTQNLSILNKYQQQAANSERAHFTPFSLITILEADDLLADGFTHCIKVEVDGEIFFLVKNNEGKLVHSGSLGYEKTFRNVETLLDTVQINTGKVRCSPITSRPFQLRDGQKVLRVFRYQLKTYCKILDGISVFGWINFTVSLEGKDWKSMASAASVSAAIPSVVLQQVRTKTEEVNGLLRNLFNYFNSTTHQQNLPPQWKVDSFDRTILCTLQGNSQVENFQRSTMYLAKDIQNIVLGYNLVITYSLGRIEITH